MSPLSEVESDLKVIREWQPRARRIYLTGGNPFALSYNKLMDIAILLRKYLPEMVSFGMFARVTDIASKSVEELKNLRHMKMDNINIGMETAHNPTLERMSHQRMFRFKTIQFIVGIDRVKFYRSQIFFHFAKLIYFSDKSNFPRDFYDAKLAKDKHFTAPNPSDCYHYSSSPFQPNAKKIHSLRIKRKEWNCN